ncbi:MAG: hypothetical protein K2W96_02980 [Gemmataceae bacterium]|nr:hypothetical protein [Gemmataceae bacterium]
MGRWIGSALGMVALALFAAAQAPAPLPDILPPPASGVPLPALPPSPKAPPLPRAGLQEAIDQLKSAREKLAAERKRLAPGAAPKETSLDAELHLHLLRLLAKLEARAKAAPPPIAPPPASKHVPEPIRPAPSFPDPRAPREEGLPPADQVQLAAYRFRANQFDECLATIAAIDPAGVPIRDRVWLKYLKACCLRRQGKLPEAGVLYREVAEDRLDPFLAESSVWHLSSMRWRQETQAKLGKARPSEK